MYFSNAEMIQSLLSVTNISRYHKFVLEVFFSFNALTVGLEVLTSCFIQIFFPVS